MDFPVRKKLPHTIPQWVAEGSWFFITINCVPPGNNQLCHAGTGDAVLAAWERVLAAPDYDGPPTWFHGDLSYLNLLVRDRRVGFVLLIWAIYTIAGGLTDPFIDNGAHIGGALGGALIARYLHPVVLSPLPPDRAATVRRWLWLVAALLSAALIGWVRSHHNAI